MERRGARPKELIIANMTLFGFRFLAVIRWQRPMLRSYVHFMGDDEAVVKGTAATLRQRIESGAIRRPEQERIQPATRPWYRRIWPERGVEQVVVGVVYTLVAFGIIALVTWLAS